MEDRRPEQTNAPAAVAAPRAAPPRLERLPPFRVLLHNDDANEMGYVVRSIQELASLARPRATLVMLEAHTRGVALVMVTHRERAELAVEQFRSKGLTATMEPGE